MGRDVDLHALIASLSVPALAAPAGTKRFVGVRVRWDLDRNAFVSTQQIAAIALPAVAGRIQVRVRRDHDRLTGVTGALEPASAIPARSI